MANSGVRVEGAEEVERMLRQVGAVESERLLRAAVEAGGRQIADEANRLAPGPHIAVQVLRSGGRGAEAAIGPDKEHWYYMFYETGAQAHEMPRKRGRFVVFEGYEGTVVRTQVMHPGIPPRPYLRPAVDRRGDAAIAAVADMIADAVERAVRKG